MTFMAESIGLRPFLSMRSRTTPPPESPRPQNTASPDSACRTYRLRSVSARAQERWRQRESHLSTEAPSARSAPLQPPDRPMPISAKKIFSSLGIQLRPPGPACSWISGASKRCGSRSEPMKKIARTLRAQPRAAAQLWQGQKAVFPAVVVED